MVLSETLRLQLFQVNRGGIGSSSGPSRSFNVGPQDRLILTLELLSSEFADTSDLIYSDMAHPSDDLCGQCRQFLRIETLSFLPHR